MPNRKPEISDMFSFLCA